LPWLQLLRWGNKPPQGLPSIDVTITGKQHLTGLLAALAVLYHDEDLFKQLPQQDLVSAVVYGDQLAIPRAVELGMQLLKEAAAGGEGTLECCKAMAALATLPACMLQLVPAVAAQCPTQCSAEQRQLYQGALVAALGDLEAVWTDQQLQEVLLALPLPAMELLLSSDQLRVVCEDTVLYTALRYVVHLDSIQGREAAKQALCHCVRCMHLSWHNQLAHATAADSPLFSKEQQEQLLKVLSLCLVSKEHCVATGRFAVGFELPAAWLAPERARLLPPSPVCRSWHVEVATIKAACRTAASGGDGGYLQSTTMSPPMAGLAFGLDVACAWQDFRGSAGVMVGVFVRAEFMYQPCINLLFTVTAPGMGFTRTLRSLVSNVWGWYNLFLAAPMGGDGWDEAAWAAAGLPLEGHIELQLTVEPLPPHQDSAA
jgi:hypothetical protein